MEIIQLQLAKIFGLLFVTSSLGLRTSLADVMYLRGLFCMWGTRQTSALPPSLLSDVEQEENE